MLIVAVVVLCLVGYYLWFEYQKRRDADKQADAYSDSEIDWGEEGMYSSSEPEWGAEGAYLPSEPRRVGRSASSSLIAKWLDKMCSYSAPGNTVIRVLAWLFAFSPVLIFVPFIIMMLAYPSSGASDNGAGFLLLFPMMALPIVLPGGSIVAAALLIVAGRREGSFAWHHLLYMFAPLVVVSLCSMLPMLEKDLVDDAVALLNAVSIIWVIVFIWYRLARREILLLSFLLVPLSIYAAALRDVKSVYINIFSTLGNAYTWIYTYAFWFFIISAALALITKLFEKFVRRDGYLTDK